MSSVEENWRDKPNIYLHTLVGVVVCARATAPSLCEFIQQCGTFGKPRVTAYPSAESQPKALIRNSQTASQPTMLQELDWPSYHSLDFGNLTQGMYGVSTDAAPVKRCITVLSMHSPVDRQKSTTQ